jgi:hypothetical protein
MLGASYRYMRLALAMMALAVLVAMMIEKLRSPGWETAISSYYYTAARPIFTGALIGIGGLLIAIKGRTRIEDVALNLAGMMAPLVPLIPPGQSSSTDGSSISTVGFGITDRQHHELLVNGLTTVLIIAIASFLLVYVVGKVKKRAVKLETHDWVGLVIAGGVAVVGVVLYLNVDLVHDHAHPSAASLMFVFLWPAIVANAYSAPERRYRTLYSAVAISMIVVLLGVVVGDGSSRALAAQHTRVRDPRADSVPRLLGGADVRAVGRRREGSASGPAREAPAQLAVEVGIHAMTMPDLGAAVAGVSATGCGVHG